MFIIRESIPDALDLAAHLVAQKVLSSNSEKEQEPTLLQFLAHYMEYRYVGDYEQALLALIDLAITLYGKPHSEEHLWIQLASLIDEMSLAQSAIDEINKKVGVAWV